MKKIISIMLVLMFVVLTVGCEEGSEPKTVTVANFFKDASTVAYVSDEDALFIADTVDGKWKKGICDCVNDVRICIGDEVYKYSSTCGTFNDSERGKSLVLSADERKAFNEVLQKYIRFGADEVELFIGMDLNIDELDVNVSYANWTEESRIYTDALNSEEMYISSIEHLPIYRFDTLKEMKAFKNKFGGVLTMNHGYNRFPSFNDATEKYDDEFFEENSLILVYVTSNSGSLRYGVNGVFCDGKSFTVSVVQTNAPEMMTWDMAGWFITLAVSDSKIENCVEFDAVFNGIENAAEDFSFSLTWNCHGISSYDSATGKLVKTTDTTHPEDYITTHILTEDEITQIYEMIRELDVESYPDTYNPHKDGASKPPMTLILSVHTNMLDKTISAKNIAHSYSSEDEKGQEFLSVCRAIIDILMATDEWKAMPEFEFVYD